VLIALVFWIFNHYMKRTSSLMFKKWDVNVVTAGDFTVEYLISKNIWGEYKEEAKKRAEAEAREKGIVFDG
tara:strand:+ start:60 stop:272 length:213 start_codon:yes stop_codon:yes gene_type:complete